MDASNCLGGSPSTSENVIYDSGMCKNVTQQIIDICNAKKANNTPDEVVCMIIGLNALFQKMSPIEKGNLTMAIQNSSSFGTIRFIMVETIDQIKSISYEAWYKASIDLSQGVWIGNGIANQFTLNANLSST